MSPSAAGSRVRDKEGRETDRDGERDREGRETERERERRRGERRRERQGGERDGKRDRYIEQRDGGDGCGR